MLVKTTLRLSRIQPANAGTFVSI